MQLAAASTSWSPTLPRVIERSTRADGLLSASFQAWWGRPEGAPGVALSIRQVDTMTDLLAPSMRLPSDAVRGTLERVRVQVGGPAADAGNVATTIGHNVYVSDAAHAARILSWEGRRWLAHELAHTMQWLREDAPSDARRDRAFLGSYLDGFAAADGSLGHGGLMVAWREFQRRQQSGEPGGSLPDLLHDSHPMEREAARVAMQLP